MIFFSSFVRFFFFLSLLGPHPQHMEVFRLGVESELQLLAYTTATAMWDPSHLFNLHHSHSNAGSETCLRPIPQIMAMQGQILNPLSKARDGIRNLMVPSLKQPRLFFFFFFFLFFRTTPTAHGSSQARGQIRATVARPHHSHGHARSEPCL